MDPSDTGKEMNPTQEKQDALGGEELHGSASFLCPIEVPTPAA
jgi:hypothetical protein